VRRRLRRLSERDWRLIDRLLVAALFVGTEIDVFVSSAIEGPRVLNALLLGGLVLTLLWRRTRPLVTLTCILAGLTLSQLVLTPPPETFAAVLLLITSCYAVGAHEQGRRSLVGLALACVSVTTLALIFDPGDVFWPVAFFCIVPWLAGRTLSNQTQLARELAEKAEHAEHERAEEERRAIAAERSRIARELHDVLAHSLSVMVVQSGAARRIVERDPERAVEVANLVQETGREALHELRRLFGTVRRGQGEELSGPPSIARVDDLVRRADAAGLAVDLTLEGEPVELPTGVDLTAYRVVQEALTNTIKHAGATRASVTISYEPGEVVVSVRDHGGTDAAALAEESGGHGLVGMRERVSLYGGTLEAGTADDGGFAVRASLPTREVVPA
jgi:signal transduction histidine kinase